MNRVPFLLYLKYLFVYLFIISVCVCVPMNIDIFWSASTKVRCQGLVWTEVVATNKVYTCTNKSSMQL